MKSGASAPNCSLAEQAQQILPVLIVAHRRGQRREPRAVDVAPWSAYWVAQARGTCRPRGGGAPVLRQSVYVEDVVAEDQRHARVSDEVSPDHEGLGQAFRTRLDGVGETQPKRRAVAK